jgi:hypothetical protein
MKQIKDPRQKPAMPGTVIDARDITLSAEIAVFDEALVKRFKAIAAKAPAGPEAFGEEGPVLAPATNENQHGGDDAV